MVAPAVGWGACPSRPSAGSLFWGCFPCCSLLSSVLRSLPRSPRAWRRGSPRRGRGSAPVVPVLVARSARCSVAGASRSAGRSGGRRGSAGSALRSVAGAGGRSPCSGSPVSPAGALGSRAAGGRGCAGVVVALRSSRGVSAGCSRAGFAGCGSAGRARSWRVAAPLPSPAGFRCSVFPFPCLGGRSAGRSRSPFSVAPAPPFGAGLFPLDFPSRVWYNIKARLPKGCRSSALRGWAPFFLRFP